MKTPPSANRYNPSIFPPWQHGANNDAIKRGLEFTVPEVDNLADFHGDPRDPKLSLFLCYGTLVAVSSWSIGVQRSTLLGNDSAGITRPTDQSAGTVTWGNMTWTVKADCYFAGLVQDLIDQGLLAPPVVPYVTNTLTITVPKGNLAGVRSLSDLGKPDVRLAMPNPAFEGIVEQIKTSRTKAAAMHSPRWL
jgi:hypothetical protein